MRSKAWLSSRVYRAADSEAWLREVLEPVLSAVPQLGGLELRIRGRVPKEEAAEVWLGAVVTTQDREDRTVQNLKEFRVQRSPPVVEVYRVIEHGRNFYRSLLFTSDAAWSFHAPASGQLLLQNSGSAAWSIAAGELVDTAMSVPSVVVCNTSEKLGRRMHVPRRFFRGLLPDALLERYLFWRCPRDGAGMASKIVGEEVQPGDEATRLHIIIDEGGEGAAAQIQRVCLRRPEAGATILSTSEWEEDKEKQLETLVNLRRGPTKLTHVLARLESLSYILAWAGRDGSTGVRRVELPRLRLSFTAIDGRLHCDQHHGFWFSETTPTERVNRLLSQWGGGTALLENASGELRVLVSALAEPIRPAAGPAADGFLPSQAVLRRGDQAWVANLAEGSRHYYYPVHLSGTFAFAPTPAAGLYLLLCRFFTWHFAEASEMAATVSELSSSEEKQLWDRLCFLASAPHHPDAAACCLRLALATAPYRNAASMRWDTGRILLEYVRKRHLLSASCRLSAEQELQLLVSQQGVGSSSTAARRGQASAQPLSTLLPPELGSRRVALQELLSPTSGDEQLELPACLGAVLEDDGFDRVDDKTFMQEVGLFERISATLSDVTYNRPEKPNMRGQEAVAFLDGLFSIISASSASAPFALLYELFTSTVSLQVVDGDDSHAVASCVLRLCCRDGTKSAGLSVLRTLELNPPVCSQMPKWGSSDLTWSFGLGAFKFDTQSTSKLIEAAGKKLKSLERSLVWTRAHPASPTPPRVVRLTRGEARERHFWAAPLTKDVLCSSRILGPELAAEFGNKPLRALESKFIQSEKEKSGLGPGGAAVQKALDQLKQSSSAGVCPPGSMPTLARLLQELQYVAKGPGSRLHLGPSQKLAATVGALAKELSTRRTEDARMVEASVQAAVDLANKGSASDWIRRAGGLWPRLGFSSLVAALMAEEPGAAASVQKVNPSLSLDGDLPRLRELVASALLHTIRIGQVARAQHCLQELRQELQGEGPDLATSLRAQAVAAQLGASRHFTETTSSKSGARKQEVSYDPRLLTFEFLCNIMLRESQVRLVKAFSAKAQAGKSMCQQMIMGEGKTTVIAPLLVLLLADSVRLVCACTPHALLDMSRAMMAERFSSPVLPRPVLTLHFHRQVAATPGLLAKLEAARQGQAAVLAAPSSVKSVLLRRLELLLELLELQRAQSRARSQSDSEKGSWLRFPSWLSSASNLEAEQGDLAAQERSKADEVRLCGDVLRLFHGGFMLLDEVDLLLDPLRSELNWPLGRRFPLDMTGHSGRVGSSRQTPGVRYSLAFDLLDAVFAAATNCPEITASAARRDAQQALGALAGKLKQGRRELKLQVAPHLVLLSRDFYSKEMLPHLVDWAALLVEDHLEGMLSLSDLRALLRQPSPDARVRQLLRNASRQALKVLNLTLDWLHHLLPYLLSKVHRVSYGLLTGHDFEAACQDKTTPLSRKLLAVPFVGKDTPSSSSEFSHPDITIGFTILAYRLNGLRERDVITLLKVLLEEMRSENTVHYHRRTACKAYVTMVIRAGGKVRGFTEDGRWIGDLKEEEQRRRSESNMSKVSSQQSLSSGGGDSCEAEERHREVWPLELLDLADPEQTKLVFKILCHSSTAVRHLLEHHTFTAGTLDRNDSQLTASGQELAGPQLFGQCLGFSGTPNDLLPKAMGPCNYAEGDDGKVLQALSCTQNVSVRELAAWTPLSILDAVAKARSPDKRRPRYQTLIDSGALVTGMTNREVAMYLLKNGLEGLDGVLFLNERDERVVLEREGFRTVELAQCGLSPEQRFTFYDHVHTTGMDVKQPLMCTACLTLSKDMTFRDYAQGAYRMRCIGRGQQIELLLTPEVAALLNKSLSKVERVSEEARANGLASLKKRPEAWSQRLIVDIISWLVLNGLWLEAKKQQLLHQQDLQNIWRSAACQCLEPGAMEMDLWLSQERTKIALAELVSKVDFSVSGELPGEGIESLEQRLRKEAAEHVGKGKLGQSVWAGEAARDKARLEAEEILQKLTKPTAASYDDPASSADFGLCSEQVHEQEQEHEEEAEEDHEQEVELEEELDKVPEAPADMKYARDCEEAVGWPLQSLTALPGSSGVHRDLPFYPLGEFAVNKGILNESCEPLAGLPSFVMLSENYYRQSWRLTSVRRLRNIICFMEWVPSVEHLKRLTVSPGALTGVQRARLREALELCGGGREDCSAGLASEEVRTLCNVLDLGREGEALAAMMPPGGRLPLAKIESDVACQTVYKMQQGRFYVALSLEEAEHLRASMHLMRAGRTWPARCGLALRCIACKESGRDDSLLDSFGPVLSSSELGYQLEAAEQMLRFLNSSEDFQAREVNILLRSMQFTRLQDRLPWWLDVRACRRRSHRPWQRLSVSKVLTRADEFEDWATKALLLRLRWSLAAQQLWPADAFRLMDTSSSGSLQKKDLQAGLDRLGVRRDGLPQDRWAQEVENLFHLLDKDGREVLHLEDFRAALELQAEDWEVAPTLGLQESLMVPTSPVGPRPRAPVSPAFAVEPSGEAVADTAFPREATQSSSSSSAPPAAEGSSLAAAKAAAATNAAAASAAAAAAAAAATPLRAARFAEGEGGGTARLTPEMCRKLTAGRFKLKWQKHSACRPLWVSSSREKPLSIWAPVELIPRRKFLGVKRGSHAVKERVSLGHYACSSFSAPSGLSLLEVTDEQYTGFFAKHPRDELNHFMNLFFPHPIRFRQLWHHKEGPMKTLYVWEPIPPAVEYVAVGMVCTLEDEAPALEEMRCVPRFWAERLATSSASKVWGAAGEAGGMSATLWSNSGSGSGLLHVTVGAAAQVSPETLALCPDQQKFYVSWP
eukprot:TRINITY_DN33879_c0_g1_i1.p1 TRINITY_DN33879_c0_g1~~TRINITY_DN33879_c0_g1_i1.p1  ORF type:complete len:3259 (+),score=710.44 TRINITY_DN33879_c0_g1_i1:1294-9777(+)